MQSEYWHHVLDTHTKPDHRADLEKQAKASGSDWKRVFLLKSLGYDRCKERGWGDEYNRVVLDYMVKRGG